MELPKTSAARITPVELRTDGELQPYGAPRLTAYGDLRCVTLGGSPGVLDSGSPSIRDPLHLPLTQGYEMLP